MPEPPKVSLIQSPTPLHRLDRMSERLGVNLWMKRDDLTGFAFGGNKGRKLEYLIASAIVQQADTIVTCGAVQSNFVRQLGAACSMYGIGCTAVVMPFPFDRPAGEPTPPSIDLEGGNALLGRLLGIDIRMIPNGDWETLYEAAEHTARSLEAEGKRVMRVPVGGSADVGAYAFYQAGLELQIQLRRLPEPLDWIVFASSSGSTQTGLAYAFADKTTRILGICCDPEPEMVEDFAVLGDAMREFLEPRPRLLGPEKFLLNTDYVGNGYGIPSEEGWKAIELMARVEGVFLDPVYTAKAFAGLMDLVQRGDLSGNILFWHTGGLPSLFAYQREARSANT